MISHFTIGEIYYPITTIILEENKIAYI